MTALPRGLTALIAKPRAAYVLMRIATALDRPLMRFTRGRLRLSFIIPMLLLECRGRRSGNIRRTPLLYVADGQHLLLVASNAGGPKDPAWCLDLTRAERVSCLVSGRRLDCRVERLYGDLRTRAMRTAAAFFPGYDAYSAQAGREIPVFRLEPLEES